MAWKQRANGHPIIYQNGPQHSYNTQVSQINNFDTQHCNRNNHFLPKPEPLPPPKRANKRRFRHDVPGPAGAWFQLQKRKSKRNGNDIHVDKGKETQAIKPHPEEVSSSPNTKSKSEQNSKSTSVQLFKDYSSKLHDCNAWNLMCQTHERIIPPFHSFVAHHLADAENDKINTNAASRFRRFLRNVIPQHQSLIHEIHTGQYDTHHLSPSVHTNDLRIPLLFGYVAHISCHTHSDWTAVLVDESYSCGGGNRGITCWLEEGLVKRHPSWIRPGAVWMVEGAKLALFTSKEEQFDEDNCEGNDGGITNDISPSTEAARSGYAIDRMILVGEDSLVYAWTPEEASQYFSDSDYTKLLERRCNVDFESGLETSQIDIVEGGFIEAQRNRLPYKNCVPRASSVLTQESKSQEGQKISPVVSWKDIGGLNHSIQDSAHVSATVESSQNEISEKSIVDSAAIQTVVGEHTQISATVRSKKQDTDIFQEQHASKQQCASILGIAGKCVQGSAAVQTAPAERRCANNNNNNNNPMDNGLNEPATDAVAIVSTTQNKRTSQCPTTHLLSSKRATLATESTGHGSSGDPGCSSHETSASPQKTTRPNPYLTSSVASGQTSSSVHKIQGCSITSDPLTSPKLSGSAVHTKSPQTGNSFDTSLDIDDDQLFYTNKQSFSRAKQNDEVNQHRQNKAEKAPTLPPMANNEKSRVKTSESNQCPSTGGSFDDSLDINEDELFYTSNRTISKSSQPATGTRHLPDAVHNTNALPVNSKGEQHKLDSQLALQITANNTSTKKFVSQSASSIFDHIGDEDLDSLGDED